MNARWTIRPPGVVFMGFLLACPAVAVAEVEHRVSGRAQIGVVHDSNVLEELGDETSDQHLSLFGSVDHRTLIDRRLRISTSARAGVLRFRDVEGDSRVLGQGRLGLAYELPSGVSFGATLLLDGRDYADSESARGYGLLNAELFFRAPLGPFVGEVVGGRTLLDYKITPGQEQRGNRIHGSLTRRLFRHVVVGARGGTGSFRFNRRAVRIGDGGTPIAQAFNQRDEYTSVGVDVQYLRRVLTALRYTYFRNDSNTFGNAYDYHRVELSIRYRLSVGNLSIGLTARGESRTYDDDLSGFNVINFDSEREENNHLILEVGRPLQEDILLKVRAGVHRNESVFRDRHYDRFQAETHLEWQF